jgi:hypothetical protein
MLLGLGHHFELLAQVLTAELELGRHGLVVGRRQRPHEAAATHQVAGDLLLLDEVGDVVVGGARLAMDGDGARQSLFGHDLPKAVLEGLADEAAVAGAGAMARVAGLDHGHLAAAAGQRQGRREAGEARAHHRHVDLVGQGLELELGPRRGLPPVGLLLEAGREDGVVDVHGESPPWRADQHDHRGGGWQAGRGGCARPAAPVC